MVKLEQLSIAFITGTLGQGGAERQLFYILRSLKEQGARLRLLSLTQGEFWEEKIRDLGIPVVWVGEKRSRPQRLWHIVQVLRQNKPDIIQSQHSFTNLYTTVVARYLGRREIGAIRTDALKETQAIGLMGYLSLRLPRLLAVNSVAAIDNAVQMGVASTKLHFLPNVIDTAIFHPIQREKKETVTILYVGRLIPQKRVDRFLRLLACLNGKTAVPVKGIIVGDGPLKEQLEQQAIALGLLPEHLDFCGPTVDIASVYHKADILLLTSDWEGTPNVIMEAMATALPVVATNVGGVPNLIDDGINGYLFSPDNESNIVEALVRLVNDSDLRSRVGQHAHNFISFRHSLAQLPANLVELYDKSLSSYQ